MSDKLQDLANFLHNLSGSPVVGFCEKPQGVDNCIVFKQISCNPIHTSSSKIEVARMQIDAYGATDVLSRSLAETIKTALDGNTTNFRLGFLINDFTIKDQETQLFRSILEFQIF
jgi:hypothetical protein